MKSYIPESRAGATSRRTIARQDPTREVEVNVVELSYRLSGYLPVDGELCADGYIPRQHWLPYPQTLIVNAPLN